MNAKLATNDQNIARVRSSKSWGLIIDDELHFKEHIKLVCNKIFKYSGILCTLYRMVPCNIMNKNYIFINRVSISCLSCEILGCLKYYITH